MHVKNIRIHLHLFADRNKEMKTKYGYWTETSGETDKQIMTV